MKNKSMSINNSLLVVLSVFIISCNNEVNSNKEQELAPEKKAYLEQQAKQEESDHDHSKVKTIENNTRVSVPIVPESEKKRTKADLLKGMETKEEMRAKSKVKMQKLKRPVPDACQLITDKFIAKVIGVDVDAITLKDGSSPASPYARSCFFRWDHRGVPNSGVLVQVKDNPVPDEFPEWAAYYIQSKKNSGEKSPDGAFEFKYADFPYLGVSGAYNYELHRYIWRDERDFVYMIAFNLPASEAEELEWARQLGEEVMRNAKF